MPWLVNPGRTLTKEYRMDHIEKLRTKALLALAPVLLLAALVLAPAASATKVTPANEEYKATSTTAKFLPTNAYSKLYTWCKASSATFTTPTEVAGQNNNQNRGPAEAGGPVGEFSTGGGGVIMSMTKPEFTKCGLYEEPGEVLVSEEVTVETNVNNGNWTTSVDAPNATTNVAAIAVPKAAAVINIAAFGLALTVSPKEASAIMADVNNEAQTLRVDSQLRFEPEVAAIGLLSPAQFEGTYSLEPINAGGKLHVEP
jgi:hypothetical protein